MCRDRRRRESGSSRLESRRPFASSVFRSRPNNLTASSPFTPLTASSTLSEIGCEKFQSTPGNCCSFLIHGGDQFVLLAVEFGAPFFARTKIDEEFGVVETAGVAAVVGASDLADDLLDFGKIRQHDDAPALPCPCSRRGRCWARECRAPRLRLHRDAARNSEPMIPLIAMKSMTARASSPMPSVNFMWSKHQSRERRVAAVEPLEHRVAPLFHLPAEEACCRARER